jgi:hypothetical protein
MTKLMHAAVTDAMMEALDFIASSPLAYNTEEITTR